MKSGNKIQVLNYQKNDLILLYKCSDLQLLLYQSYSFIQMKHSNCPTIFCLNKEDHEASPDKIEHQFCSPKLQKISLKKKSGLYQSARFHKKNSQFSTSIVSGQFNFSSRKPLKRIESTFGFKSQVNIIQQQSQQLKESRALIEQNQNILQNKLKSRSSLKYYNKKRYSSNIPINLIKMEFQH